MWEMMLKNEDKYRLHAIKMNGTSNLFVDTDYKFEFTDIDALIRDLKIIRDTYKVQSK